MSFSNNNLFKCPFTSLISEINVFTFIRNVIDLVMYSGVKPLSAFDSDLLATSELFVFVTDIIIHLYLIKTGEILYLY